MQVNVKVPWPSFNCLLVVCAKIRIPKLRVSSEVSRNISFGVLGCNIFVKQIFQTLLHQEQFCCILSYFTDE